MSKAADEILRDAYPVLDHGFIKLVDYMGDDEAVEEMARVSCGNGTREVRDTEALIRYLMRRSHTSPFEAIELKFHLCAPIFVARQWLRTRTASGNELSGRHSVMQPHYYTPDRSRWQKQSKSNKQGSSSERASGYDSSVHRMHSTRQATTDNYSSMLRYGVARELARIDLPLSTYTEWYWKIDSHNLMRFLCQRLDDGAQWEIRQYAEVMAGMLARVAPITYEAFCEYQLCSSRLSATELQVVAGYLPDAEDLRELMLAKGASAREADELSAKFAPKKRPRPLDKRTP
jgi:thymidylate synthase (FAD)